MDQCDDDGWSGNAIVPVVAQYVCNSVGELCGSNEEKGNKSEIFI